MRIRDRELTPALNCKEVVGGGGAEEEHSPSCFPVVQDSTVISGWEGLWGALL